MTHSTHFIYGYMEGRMIQMMMMMIINNSNENNDDDDDNNKVSEIFITNYIKNVSRMS